MKLDTIPFEFQQAQGVIEKLQQNGYEAYFVGGSVRDALLEKPIHDVDIATSAYPEEIKQLFSRTVDVGIEHGTVLVLFNENQYELTTFRTESTYQDFRRPDKVTFVRSLKEDLKRRDFTINALAMDQDGTIVDLFDGMADLKNQIIRAVGDPKARIHEDALRMMRAVRFASQLNFKIEDNTLAAIQEFHFLLKKISVERISVEMTKLFLGKNRRAGLVPFVETECYLYCPQLKEHGEALLSFSELPNQPLDSPQEAWSLFVFMLKISKDNSATFLKEWKLSNQLIHAVQQIIIALEFRMTTFWSPRMLFDLGLERALIVEKLLVYFGNESERKKTKELYASLPIHHRNQLAVSGNDIMAYTKQKPGKWIGEMLNRLESKVINANLENDKDVLLLYVENCMTKE